MKEDIIHCAIYTRKSDHLDPMQEFNTLDNQYEICKKFIGDSKENNLCLVNETYDDGNFSGENLNRPALQHLIADIRDGQVNRIYIYKIDRLTRSVRDFYRLLDIMEENSVEFVSVTESDYFNNYTPTGRIFLQMFLMFAEFERENSANRIRDKIAASKKMGMWTGGKPCLGYDVSDRQLVINNYEAMIVREIFQQFYSRPHIKELVNFACQHKFCSESYCSKIGKNQNGHPLKSTDLLRILKNPLYKGKTLYKGELYTGKHQAIIDGDLWEKVNKIIQEKNYLNTKIRLFSDNTFLFSGVLYCGICKKTYSASFAKKGNRKYHYYRCPTHKTTDPHISSVASPEIDNFLIFHLIKKFNIIDWSKKIVLKNAIL